MLNAQLEEQLRKLDGILNTDLAAFEETARHCDITLLDVPKARR